MCSVDVTGVSNQPGCQGCGNPDSIDQQRGTQCCDTSAKCRPLILRGVESGMGVGEDFLEEAELEMKRKRKRKRKRRQPQLQPQSQLLLLKILWSPSWQKPARFSDPRRLGRLEHSARSLRVPCSFPTPARSRDTLGSFLLHPKPMVAVEG